MDESFEAEGATVLHSLDEVLELSKGREVFIIGGGEIYYQTIDIADKLMMTHVHVIDGKARVFFPDYNLKQWKITKVEQHEKSEQYDFSYTFANYERKQD
jgi:dihydrofolate reductase